MAEAAIPKVRHVANTRVQAVASAARGGWLAAAAVLFAGFTVAAFLQPHYPDPGRVREPFSREWWLYPREEHAAKQWLPRVEADLNGIYALEGPGPGRERIWAVGNLGLIVYSSDGGKSWTKQTLPAPVPETAPPEPAPPANPPPARRPVQPMQVIVPSVVNQQIEFARKTLAGLGLHVDVQYIDLLDRRLPGSVVDQKPASGTRAARGDTVTLVVKRDALPVQQTSPPVQQTAPIDLQQNKAPEPQPAKPAQNPPAQEQRRGEAAKDDDAAWWPLLADVVYAQSNASPPPQGPGGIGPTRRLPVESPLEDLMAVFAPSERVRIAIDRSNTAYFSVDGDPWTQLVSANALARRQGVSVRLETRSLEPARAGASWGAAGPNGDFMWFPDPQGNLFTAVDTRSNISGSLAPGTARFENVRHLAGDHEGKGSEGIAWALGTTGNALIFHAADQKTAAIPSPRMTKLRWFWIAPRAGERPSDRLPPAWFVGEQGTLLLVNQPAAGTATVESVNVPGGASGSFDLRVETVPTGTTANLNSICFLPNNQTGWIAGDKGTILRSDDGGKTWVHQTQGVFADLPGEYERSLPPWYFLSWLLVGLVLAPAFRKEKPQEVESESVADLLVSDRPLQIGDPDPMQLHAIAEGLSRFMRNENTEPPLTIAITGEWGTGKSSLMNLLQSSLLGYRMRPVWFNAWHHQKDQHLLASLVQNIRLQAVPPWWHPQGWIFGARLFLSRGWRTWFPVAMLVALLAFLGGFFHQMVHQSESFSVSDVADLFAGLAKLLGGELPAETTAGEKGALALTLIGTLASIYASYRKLVAFGVNPAALLAGKSGSAGMGALEAQTGFRKKFADQFAEVTNALGADRLVIFIDDLDRCQPDSVVEVLEAVNFLVSSGRCFVVLGMDSKYVERCVGLSFTKVAEEMADDVEADESGKLRTLDAKQKRQDFAHNYLQKLINIEVPLPAPTPSQISQLLTGEAADGGDRPAKRGVNWVPALSWAGRTAALCLGLFFIFQAFELGSNPSWLSLREQRGAAAVNPAEPGRPRPAAVESTGSGSADLQGTSSNPAPEAGAEKLPAITHPSQKAEVVIAEERTGIARWLGHWPVLIILMFLVAAAYWVLTRRPDLVVRDSPEFVEALRIWQPAVVARQNTPRAVKRFLNRVRYFAMRQRPPASEMTLGQRIRANLARLMGAAGDEARPVESKRGIPEHALVALAAIAEYRDEATPRPLVLNEVEKSHGVLAEALARHSQRFDAAEIDRQSAAFVTMAGGVDVR